MTDPAIAAPAAPTGPGCDIVDMEAHRRQAMARGYSVMPGERPGTWQLMSPYDDYRGTFPTLDAAWRSAPRDRRSRPRD